MRGDRATRDIEEINFGDICSGVPIHQTRDIYICKKVYCLSMGEPFSFGLGCRKIRESGRTPVIVIPKVWADNYGVKKGDIVSIEVLQGGDLLIKAPQH